MAVTTLSLTSLGQPARPENPAGPAGPGVGAGQCVSNISRAEQRKRLLFGIVAFAFGMAILAALLAAGAAPIWRLALLPVFWGAASAFFQWRDKT